MCVSVVEALSGAVAVEDPYDTSVEVGVSVVGVTRDFAQNLGPPVRRVWVRGDRLILGEPIETVVRLAVDARRRGEEYSIDTVACGGIEDVLIHKDTRGETADVLPLYVVNPAHARSEVEHVVDSVYRFDTALVCREIDGADLDLVGDMVEFVVPLREIIRDNDIGAACV